MKSETQTFNLPEFKSSFAAEDSRGIFSASPLTPEWIQINTSYNKKAGTLRGMHYQLEPHAQTKLVKVVHGSIWDVVVDIRPESPTFLMVYDYEMQAGEELLVPKGFAHGFVTLEDHTVVQYLIDAPYVPEADRSTNWQGIRRMKSIVESFIKELIISDKDKNAPFLIESDL
jgi:dTDP-4-dehydrorhamnose 3,5-epimerase